MASISEQLAAKKNRKNVDKLTSGHDVNLTLVNEIVSETALMPKNINIEYLKVSPDNTYSYNEGDILELEESILRLGILDYPIVEMVSGTEYAILSGQKRFLAVSRLLKDDPVAFERIFPRRQIPCKVVDFDKMQLFGEKADEEVSRETKRLFVIAAGNQQHEKTVRDYMLQVEQLSIVYAEMKSKGIISGQRQREFVAEHTNMQTRSSQKVLSAKKNMHPGLWSVLKDYEGLVSITQLERLSRLPERTQREIYEAIKRGDKVNLNVYLADNGAAPEAPAFWTSFTVSNNELQRMFRVQEFSDLSNSIRAGAKVDATDMDSLEDIGKKMESLRKKAEKILRRYR